MLLKSILKHLKLQSTLLIRSLKVAVAYGVKPLWQHTLIWLKLTQSRLFTGYYHWVIWVEKNHCHHLV